MNDVKYANTGALQHVYVKETLQSASWITVAIRTNYENCIYSNYESSVSRRICV